MRRVRVEGNSKGKGQERLRVLSSTLIFCGIKQTGHLHSVIQIRKKVFVVLNMKIYNLINMLKSELLEKYPSFHYEGF